MRDRTREDIYDDAERALRELHEMERRHLYHLRRGHNVPVVAPRVRQLLDIAQAQSKLNNTRHEKDA